MGINTCIGYISNTMAYRVYLFIATIVASLAVYVSATDVITSAPTPEVTTLTPTPQERCMQLNTSCDSCLDDKDCYWCSSTNGCYYTETKFLGIGIPSDGRCSLASTKYGTCTISLFIFAITGLVLLGVFLLSVCACCCCCYCSRNAKMRARLLREEQGLDQQRQDIHDRADDRRQEQTSRYNAIREKYGIPTKANKYKKMEEDGEQNVNA